VSDDLHLDNQLCFALYAASHAMTRAYIPLLERMGGLTYPQYAVLLVLWERDGLAVNEIAAKLALDSSTITPLLRRMEKLGLLTRTRPAHDERRVEVRLTDDGRELRAEARQTRQALLLKTGLPPEAVVKLREQLRRLFASLTGAEAPTASSKRAKKPRP
jgi:MarR family transcriptional regulator, organic hydroperoxide resistance regulator